jgi:PIN domain nuclease of toxin-antitoxin system
MDLLLDTHALLWFLSGDKPLSKTAIEKISDLSNVRYVSIAGIWEIVIKLSLGRLEIKGGFETIEDFFENNDFEILPIDFSDTKILLKLEMHHRDPFDRILIAQAIANNLTIITKDSIFSRYTVNIFW